MCNFRTNLEINRGYQSPGKGGHMATIISISILVLIGIGLLVYTLVSSTTYKMVTGIIGGVSILVSVIISIVGSMYEVPTGHVGIVSTFGGISGQVDEGLQWVLPWQKVKYASIQIQGHEFEKLASFSSETQDVYVDATINIRVSPESIQTLYREVGDEYFEILVKPRVLQAFKDATVKYKSVDIAPNREVIRVAVRDRLINELAPHSIEVTDLLVNNITFTEQFQNAIEQKQANTQLALAEREKVQEEKEKARQVIEKARGNAKAILVNAKKQAQANRALAESITPEYIQYLFASKLAPNVSVMMVPSGQPFILSPDMLKNQEPKAPSP